jgi:hypothetical protein
MKNPDLTITITGQKKKGKTCLGHALALVLQKGFLHPLQKGSAVYLSDDGHDHFAPVTKPEKFTTPFSEPLAHRFKDARRIKIVVQSADHFEERTCVYCGCTDSNACQPTCFWLEEHVHANTGVCSKCATVEKFPEGIVMLRITKASGRRKLQRQLGLLNLNLTKA